jgi:hypothetical protein
MTRSPCNSTARQRRNGHLAGWISCVFAVGWIAPTEARMYHWVDPVTQSVQLAGKPPPWYRSETVGPRVVVYERGRVVDDTRRAVAAGDRETLRATAFGEASTTNASLNTTADVPAENVPRAVDPTATVAVEPKTELPNREVPPTPDQLATFKALLEAWDREQAAAATHNLPPPVTATTPAK